MSLQSTEQKQFGLAKETVRGTIMTTPTKWYPVEKESEMTYKLMLIDDKALRGIAEEFPPNQGVKTGTGKIKMPLDAQMVGEFLQSLLGSVFSSTQQASTTAYKHVFLRTAAIQKPGYTFFLDYGLVVKGYSLATVKKLALTGAVDAMVMMEADVLFKSEVTEGIGSPAFPVNQYLGFNGVTVKVGGSTSTDIRNWALNIDNGAAIQRTLTQSQDAADILVKGKLNIGGTFTIFFQDETERSKFLAGTSNSLEFLCEGSVIASTYKYTVDIILPKVYYKSYPFQDVDGLLGANVEFDAKYDISTTKAIEVDVINKDVSY